MSTFDILAVSSRRLCGENFLARMERVAAARPAGILLREKDLPEETYEALARAVLDLCRGYGVPCILHTFLGAAERLGCRAVHLPLAALRENAGRLGGFKTVGVSVHSPAEAAEAEKLGAGYVVAGHIFPTDCKKGVPPRGISFLKEITRAVSVPVYAIGGITPETVGPAAQAGAGGVCVMSGFMRCGDPAEYCRALEAGAQTARRCGIDKRKKL